ncbi:MAG: 30S ribosomal protein S3ae [Candidatus Heimdallarchaeota archaeon]|nr:30S ribosomal protein S3ae [Candidatus Heimdallarchaeota archaeon]
MSSRAARGRKRKDKESRRVVDKFTLKTWYKIIAPEMFGGEQISETPSSDPEYVVGRTLKSTLMDLTGDYKKMHVKITFKVQKVKGDNAFTAFNGHEYTRDYLRSMIRRRRTRIDGIFNVTTKDGARLRCSIIALTPFRCKSSHERGIREVMYDVITKRAERMPFDKLIMDLVTGKMATEIYKRAKKVHPIQNVDVWKSRVLNLPTMVLEPEPPKPEPVKEVPKEDPKEKASKEEAPVEKPAEVKT